MMDLVEGSLPGLSSSPERDPAWSLDALPQEGFSDIELSDFAAAFDRIRGRLPGMFQPFWYRWSYHPEIPALLIIGDDSRISLGLVRVSVRQTQLPTIEDCRLVHPWPRRMPISQVLRKAGLL